ncbi:hypothetical protein [Ornithinimicrobium cryptoxanthini]|uniref:hypothetical protein n=1 Tax=Ornithinimicrobium cryptoxanthini TaxID=2934161 RepID=UPI002118855D|nr:hypothetical protein [Ornithinimicrobium cryptoxanthini]
MPSPTSTVPRGVTPAALVVATHDRKMLRDLAGWPRLLSELERQRRQVVPEPGCPF